MPLLRPVLHEINSTELLRYAGMAKDEVLPEEFIRTACREALLYARPETAWEVYRYEPPYILAETVFRPSSRNLAKHLGGAQKVAVLAVTIGEDIETRIGQLFAEGQSTLALLLDAAATTAVEDAADAAGAFIAAEAGKEGLMVGRRFSPGYGDWTLTEQPEVLRLANGKVLGMSLSRAFMLIPRKSITAVLPLWSRGAEAEERKTCSSCENDSCEFRRIE